MNQQRMLEDLHADITGPNPFETARPAPRLTPIGTDLERRASALAHIQETIEELDKARQRAEELERDLNRERDRVEMLTEERDHYRNDCLILRKLLVELSTQMSNIGLLTVKAQEIVKAVDNLDLEAARKARPKAGESAGLT